MSVGFFSHQPSGCSWYRIEHPMEVMRRHGIKVVRIKLDEDVILDDIKTIQLYGIYPFSFEKVLKYLKSEGKRIVYDLDDPLELIDPTNPFYYSVKRDSYSQSEILKYADHITVSTEKMANYARERTDKPITVIPNSYFEHEWPTVTRIGFAGSATHVKDLLLVLPAIKDLQKKYNISFVLMGFSKMDYETTLRQIRFTSPQEGQEALNQFEELMKDIKCEWVGNVDYDIYPQVLTNLKLDIGLCPLTSTPFNDSRSASKAMEYTLAGALSLASDTEPYRTDPTSILVKDNEWLEKLEYYILNPKIRDDKRHEHLTWLKTNRDINKQIDLLKSVYI